MLSLSPRYDLFRFSFPKDFLPEPVYNKYDKILNVNPAVINNPIDYLNESILGVSFPGISDINIMQDLHEYNSIPRIKGNKINVEPKHEIVYTSSKNPLESINKEFKVSFRLNLGFYNYFMIYETIFYLICKPLNKAPIDVLYVELLDELGNIISRISFKQVYLDGIDGLEFNYNKIERTADTFDVNFKFNNIDYDIINPDKVKQYNYIEK